MPVKEDYGKKGFLLYKGVREFVRACRLWAVAALVLALAVSSGISVPAAAEGAVVSALDAFAASVDVDYAKSALETIRAFGNNPEQGFRTAGSPAELAARDYIAEEMEKFGFTVTKDPVTLDTWNFTEGFMTFTDAEGSERRVLLAAEMINFQVKDQAYEVVYVGTGADAEYEGVDVAGKFVLIDINQVEEWWISWPAYQAYAKGAAGAIFVSSGGYATYSEDSVGVQDYCAPASVVALNISITDGNALKAAIEKNGGSVMVSMTVDSVVEFNGTAYNVVCELQGTDDSLQAVSMMAHYDAYFHAFDDNTSGSATLLGIAKAMSDSGYQPRRTVRFVFDAAEEWGLADSRFDWCAGAWVGAQNHPEWADNTFMAINIDGGVVLDQAFAYRMRAPYEFADYILGLGRGVEGNPFGFKTRSPMYSWTDGWAFSISGIPTIDSGIEPRPGVAGGSYPAGSAYHTDYDNEESAGYSRETFAFSIKLYGSLALMFDQTDVRPTDYEDLFSAFIDTMGGDNYGELADAAAKAGETAAELTTRLTSVAPELADATNRQLNTLFKDVHQKLYSIDWEGNVGFVYEYKQTNVDALTIAIDALKNGDAAAALDDCLWQIDLNWYAYAFDNETVEYYINQVLGEDAKNAWGTGYLTSAANLRNEIRSLTAKAEVGETDFTEEIASLEKELARQQADLDAIMVKAVEDISTIVALMDSIAR